MILTLKNAAVSRPYPAPESCSPILIKMRAKLVATEKISRTLYKFIFLIRQYITRNRNPPKRPPKRDIPGVSRTSINFKILVPNSSGLRQIYTIRLDIKAKKPVYKNISRNSSSAISSLDNFQTKKVARINE